MPAPDSELFRNVLEGLHTGVYVVDRNRKVLFWNDGAERITGYLRQDMMGRQADGNFLTQMDSDGNELEAAKSPIALALRDGKPLAKQVSLRHKEGHRVPVQLHTFAIRDQHGSIS